MKRIALILFLTSLLTACVSTPSSTDTDEQSVDESLAEFLTHTQIGLVVDGKDLKLFDRERDQIIFDDKKTMFVISNSDYSEHLTLNINGAIYLNNLINVSYASSGIENFGSGEIAVTVAKIDSSELRYWLWSSELSVGFVIDFSM